MKLLRNAKAINWFLNIADSMSQSSVQSNPIQLLVDDTDRSTNIIRSQTDCKIDQKAKVGPAKM